MSSRGSFAKNKHVTDEEYEIVDYLGSIKILKGRTKKSHGLPDYAHSARSIYAKINDDGTVRELRIYNDDKLPEIEFGCHPEPKLNNGNREDKILHYHDFDGLNRSEAKAITREIADKYKDILVEANLYDKL